jgi:hypothetical protein
VSASPLDSTTTSWTWIDPRLQNDDIDNTLYEEAGFNHVFALWNVNSTNVSVDIYAGGRDLSVLIMICIFLGLFVVSFLGFVFLESRSGSRMTFGVISVVLFVVSLTLLFVLKFSVDEPRFTFVLDR